MRDGTIAGTIEDLRGIRLSKPEKQRQTKDLHDIGAD
jgi:hypothetical protein